MASDGSASTEDALASRTSASQRARNSASTDAEALAAAMAASATTLLLDISDERYQSAETAPIASLLLVEDRAPLPPARCSSIRTRAVASGRSRDSILGSIS